MFMQVTCLETVTCLESCLKCNVKSDDKYFNKSHHWNALITIDLLKTRSNVNNLPICRIPVIDCNNRLMTFFIIPAIRKICKANLIFKR